MKVPLSAYENAWEMIKREAVGSGPILVLVAYNCDAIAACRTLQSLFKLHSMSWTVEPVHNYEDITAAYETHIKPSRTLRSVFLLNCGGAVDLFEELRLYEKPDLMVYVMDSHRPFHPNNERNVNQIMLFDETDDPIILPTSSEARRAQKRQKEQEQRRLEREQRRLEREQRRKKPTTDADGDVEMSESDVYDDADEDSRADDDMSDDEEEEDEEDDFDDEDDMDEDVDEMDFDEDDETGRAKRRRRGFAKLGASTHAFSSAGLLYALSTKINKDSNEYLWNGILGITDQFIHQRIDRRRYLINLTHFRNEVARLNLEDDEINRGAGSSVTDSHRIVFVEREYAFMIYRQWNLYESMCHTRHLAVRLTLWSSQGIKKLETWLAKLGLPLEQVKQPWKAMNPELKVLLPDLLEKKTGELDLDSLFYPSFVRKPLYDKEIAASDTVWAVSALLESTKRLKMQQTTDSMSVVESNSSTATEDFTKSNFWNAFFALSTNHNDLLNSGFNEAMDLQRAIMRQVKTIMQKNEVGSSGVFRHAILRENPDTKFFCHPLSLCKLAHFIADILIEIRKYKEPKPLLVVVPRVEEVAPTPGGLLAGQTFSTYLIAGVPANHSGAAFVANEFGRAFALAASQSQATPVSYASFDSAVVEIRKEDLFKFTEGLRAALADIERERDL